jgi:HD superfamily phosphohydrolase
MPKLFKDPIYGYIEVPDRIVHKFIDTACFQRLRRIIQTSYTPLYSAARHNRFTHSLGVYYLGKIAFKNVKKFLSNHKKNIDVENMGFVNAEFEELFSIACLLHDVGHAPFSHNGEKFYTNCIDKDGKSLFEQLGDVVGNEKFKEDAKKKEDAHETAAEHEMMSVIVALRSFKSYFKTRDRDFFARCILGYKYTEPGNPENEIKNCFISILNSSIIDVDRLDYTIRDAFVSGYQNVSIDYIRLLRGLIIVKNNGNRVLAYHKSAMSIIENVIFANDSEQKWIQNHPVILYENCLIKYCIMKVEQYFKDNKHTLFQYEALTKKGNALPKAKAKCFFLSLLSDEDIIFYVKNVCSDYFTQEYFDRGARRHSLWKSEAEYMHLLNKHSPNDSRERILSIFEPIEKHLEKLVSPPIMDKGLLDNTRKELAATENEIETSHDEKTKKDLETRKSNLQKLIKRFECMEEFANKYNIKFSFVNIFTNKFRSNFSKLEIDDILIWFPSTSSNTRIKKVSPFFEVTSPSDDEDKQKQKQKQIFYFYYHGKTDKSVLQRAFFRELCEKLLEIDDT